VGLDAVGAVDDQDSAVENGHGALGLGGEVHVARRVHQGHIQMPGLQQGQLGENGDAPAALQVMGVEKRVPMIHPSQLPPGTRAVEQCFRQGRLTRIHMGQQSRTARPSFHLFGHRRCPLSWIISTIIPREVACVDIFLWTNRKNMVPVRFVRIVCIAAGYIHNPHRGISIKIYQKTSPHPACGSPCRIL